MIGCKKDIEEQVLTNPEKMHKFNIEQYDVELLSINDFPFEYAISVLYESDFYEFMNSILSVNPDRGSFIIKLQENKIYYAYLNTVLESEGNGNIIVQYGLVEDSSFVSSNFEEIMEWAHTQIEHGKIVSR
ncbi:MAG: hypothetical protein J5701_05140 [Bacteroidales bacterium]|nr:hypothetical protein [Bacteroidales bacterium]